MNTEKDSMKVFKWWKEDKKGASLQIWWIIIIDFYCGRSAYLTRTRLTDSDIFECYQEMQKLKILRSHILVRKKRLFSHQNILKSDIIWCILYNKVFTVFGDSSLLSNVTIYNIIWHTESYSKHVYNLKTWRDNYILTLGNWIYFGRE